MEARGRVLTFKDILKLYARKWLRLAPPYYFLWLILWGITSRAASGPIWSNTDISYVSCSTNYWPTALMIGNLIPVDVVPYSGCYQSAWPLQVDIQIYLFVPFLAMLYWKSPSAGFCFCLLMVVANLGMNVYYSYYYDLKIGFVAANNFNLMTAILAKPWLHMYDVAIGIVCAHLYFTILKYRRLKTPEEKAELHPILHKFHKSRLHGNFLIIFGVLLIAGNLVYITPYNANPDKSSKLHNGLYYALSRPTFVIGAAMILMAIFLGHYGFARAFLSGNNMRLLARTTAIACVFEILVIQLLFNSNATPEGI